MASATKRMSDSMDMSLNHDFHKSMKRSMQSVKDFPWLEAHLRKVKGEASKAYWEVWWERNRMVVLSVVVVFTWLFVGTIFYRHSSGFTVSQAWYFSVQAGLSVGYGAAGVTCDDSDDPTACRWYTSFHVLVGSSFIATALGLWTTLLVEDTQASLKEAEADLLEQKREKMLRAHSVVKSRAQSPEGPADLEATASSQQQTKDQFYSDLKKSGVTYTRVQRIISGFFFRAATVFLLAVAVGVIFGMLDEDWDFPQALLFAITSMSTGGLQAPSINSTAMWFTGGIAPVTIVGYICSSTLSRSLLSVVCRHTFVQWNRGAKVNRTIVPTCRYNQF
eukprot:m.90628 g.90628  ORF g.90628 m.90628 type:complete len:334 (-) comp16468_c0_seq11:370-1371(-)